MTTSQKGVAVIPPAETVRRITVARYPGIMMDDYAPPRMPVIEDPARIARISRFLAEHSRHWRKPWGLFPLHSYEITLECAEGPCFNVWDGGDWIGGPVGDVQLLRWTSEAEMRKFHELVGIPNEE